MTSHHASAPRLVLAAALAGAAVALAGCHADRIVADTYPTKPAERHPIVLAEGSERLDLPVGAGAGGLTDRQKGDVRAFVADWRKNGRGPIGLMAPAGAHGVYAVRMALASAGVPATQIVSQRSIPAAPEEVGLVKLGYVKLKAKVPHECGLWPEDLGYGAGDLYGATENRDYWNFGCATQQNIAAQVADPEDIARPRAQTPVYAARRGVMMEKHKMGEDTTTEYRQTDAVVSDVGKE